MDSNVSFLTNTAEGPLCRGALSDLQSLSRRDLEICAMTLSTTLARAEAERAQQVADKERLAKRQHMLLQVLPGGVVALDGDGYVRECNPSAQSLLGQPLSGERWRDVVHRAFAPRYDDGHEVSLRSGRRVNIATCSLGAEPGQILLIKDITETRKLQEQVAHLKRLSEIGQMVASLAHQIRTPVASCLLYLSQLRSPQGKDQDRVRILNKVTDRLRHLEQLIIDMLSFARQGNFEVEQIAFKDFLRCFVHSLEPCLAAQQAVLAYRDELPDLQVCGNAAALQSALQNIISNALQAGGARTHLQLDVRLDERSRVAIVIRDDGPGIPPQVQRRVFEPFFTTYSEGTGLGLPVACAIIMAHQGELQLSSTLGKGTTVHIALPIVRDSDRAGVGAPLLASAAPATVAPP
jgi:two-component system sensor histidine kinase FlrB